MLVHLMDCLVKWRIKRPLFTREDDDGLEMEMSLLQRWQAPSLQHC